MNRSDPSETGHRANIKKLNQLVRDAEAKATEARQDGRSYNMQYWQGVSYGLRRAITVLEGGG